MIRILQLERNPLMLNEHTALADTENTATIKSTRQSVAFAENEQIPRLYIAIIALLQGSFLTYLYQSVENEVWPGTDLTWLTALVTFTVSLPCLFLLTASKNDYKSIIMGLLPFSILISALGSYIGYQYSAFPNIESTFFIFGSTTLIACFKAVIYIKRLANKQKIDYESLFSASWRNAVIFTLTLLFMSLFFGILHLGAALFNLLGIRFFTVLLQDAWFWMPALTLASAFAIHMFRKVSYLADTISTILQTLMKFLLPVLIFVSLGFLVTLPFTGLEKLWSTNSGSSLLLWLVALSLFFVNAIYHKGSDNRPYHFLVHRFILVGVAILPIYSAISAYGIFLRVIQYGLTPDRLWAVSIWFILSCFALGYLFGILKLRDNWLSIQSKVNVVMGLVVLAFVLLVNSPVLNFQSLSSSSQMARYYDGDVSLEELDIHYFSHYLGNPGYVAMQQLKAEIAQSNPETVALIDQQYAYVQQNSERRNKMGDTQIDPELEFIYFPNQDTFDATLISYLSLKENHNRWADAEYRIAIDLDQDGEAEMLTITDQNGFFQGQLWLKTDEGWNGRNVQIQVPKNKDLKYSLENIEIQLVNPQYQIIQLDGISIDVN